MSKKKKNKKSRRKIYKKALNIKNNNLSKRDKMLAPLLTQKRANKIVNLIEG